MKKFEVTFYDSILLMNTISTYTAESKDHLLSLLKDRSARLVNVREVTDEETD